jgi:hypothetical protein
VQSVKTCRRVERQTLCLHEKPSNIFEVTHSSNAKKRAIKIEIRKKYLPNYVRYSDKLPQDLP